MGVLFFTIGCRNILRFLLFCGSFYISSTKKIATYCDFCFVSFASVGKGLAVSLLCDYFINSLYLRSELLDGENSDFRPVNILQDVEVGVVGDNVLGIGGDSAVDKLIVINILLY